MEYELKAYNALGIFRNDEVVGIKLLAHIWFEKEGIPLLKQVVVPVIEKVISYDHVLEIDPQENSNAKKNLKELLKVLDLFLEKLYSSASLFST